ncbi:GNAT family N-acetyltransferase [Piscinibacter sp. XHJ-5]|uniref:GNAT family N-acetyltransferase n=1 Tax=Piscinibacter sp. XHJ-5 TaxID=3037797 RepID=UPI002452A80A|nr:GNAT family N-acetyltransferase [Piscinibacter sp. XHJ-5]
MNPSFDPVLLSRVEDAGLNASAPPQQLLIDGWLVRFSPGKARRARCVNAVAPGRLALEQKLALCRRVFDDAGLPMLVRITPLSQPAGLDEALAQLGMRAFERTQVMVCADLGAPQAQGLPSGVTLAPVGHESFAQTVGMLRGSPLAQRQAHGQRLVNSPVPFQAYVMKHKGEVVACGQFAREGELVGLYDVFTAPAARGQGLAQRLCSHLLAEAVARGAKTAYLQVDGENLPARAVYRRLGFADAYAYHYRSSDPAAW